MTIHLYHARSVPCSRVSDISQPSGEPEALNRPLQVFGRPRVVASVSTRTNHTDSSPYSGFGHQDRPCVVDLMQFQTC